MHTIEDKASGELLLVRPAEDGVEIIDAFNSDGGFSLKDEKAVELIAAIADVVGLCEIPTVVGDHPEPVDLAARRAAKGEIVQ